MGKSDKTFELCLVMTFLLAMAGAASAEVVVDDFQSYADTSDLQDGYADWPGDLRWQVPEGVSFGWYLDSTEGFGSPVKSMRMEFDPSGTTDATGGVGHRIRPIQDWTSEDGLKLWMKVSGSGSSDTNYTFMLRWWDENSRWSSPKMSIDNLDSNGEYLYFPWSVFYHYGASDSIFDDEDLEDAERIRGLRFDYDGTAPGGSSITVWVDDITTYRVPGHAYKPSPPDGSTVAELTPICSWLPGDYTQNVNGHDVYFGSDWDEVNDADTSDLTGIYRGRQDANSYDPGALAYFTTYYWRIDEVNDANFDSPWKGEVWSFTTPAFILTFIRDPYLQNVTQNSVDVMWGDDNSSSGTVYWGDTPGSYTNSVLSDVFADVDGDYIHTATITGLSPGQKVYYYVSSGGDIVGQDDPNYYATAAPADDASFRFGAYGDSRPDYGNNPDIKPHIRVVNTMRLHEPDIVLHMGDIAREGYLYEFTDYFFAPTSPLAKNTPIFPTVGNHELYEDLTGQNYRDVYSLPVNSEDGTEEYYSFDYGMVHFVCLNTEFLPGGVNGYINPTRAAEMESWLISDLGATTKPWTVVFFHRQYFMNAINNAWRSIFEDYGVELAIAGHLHHYDSHYRNGVTYVLTGGGGSPLSGISWASWPDYRLGAFKDYHFVQVDVTPTILYLRAYDDDNNLRKELIVVSNPPPPDMDGDGDTDLGDFTILASAWMSGPDDDNWNPAANISIISYPFDNVIDTLDLATLADNWLMGM